MLKKENRYCFVIYILFIGIKFQMKTGINCKPMEQAQ